MFRKHKYVWISMAKVNRQTWPLTAGTPDIACSWLEGDVFFSISEKNKMIHFMRITYIAYVNLCLAFITYAT